MKSASNARRRGLIVLLALTMAACAAPNLDQTVAGEPASTIRERIVDHGTWNETLSNAQLDQLAGFIAEYAGAAEVGGEAVEAPGLVVWKANECGSCHALAAAGSGD